LNSAIAKSVFSSILSNKPYLYSEKEDDLIPPGGNNNDNYEKKPADSPIIGGSTGDAFGGG